MIRHAIDFFEGLSAVADLFELRGSGAACDEQHPDEHSAVLAHRLGDRAAVIPSATIPDPATPATA